MKRQLIAVSVALVLALIAGGVWWWSVQQRAQDWVEVDRALERMKAGMEHEAKIQLRTRIADAAAAVESYAKVGAGREDESRVKLARRAFSFLDLGLADYGGLYGTTTWKADKWGTFKVHELNRVDIKVGCEGEIPYVWGSDLPRAYVAVAQRALDEIEGKSPLPPFEPVNVATESEKCRAEVAMKREQRDAHEAAARAKAEAHRRAFPLHVDLKAELYSPETVVVIDGTRWVYDFPEGRAEHIDAKESVEIDARSDDALAALVNGHPWPGPWERHGAYNTRGRTKITVTGARQLAGEIPYPLRVELMSRAQQTVSVYVDGYSRAQMVEVGGAEAKRFSAQREIKLNAYKPGELQVRVNGAPWQPRWERLGRSSFYTATITVGERAGQ